MRVHSAIGILGLAVILAAGCQDSTTTGPAGKSPTGQPAAKKLTVTAAKEQTVQRGDTDKVLVTINRDNFNDPVTVKISGPPKGVEVAEKEMTIAAGSNTATFNLRAGPDAELGDHQLTITAEAPGIEKNTQTFKLTVKEK